ncbi:MAG: acyl-[acyl-carrier-protein] thioesterase [Bacteriovoracaceae bacterium]
MKKNIWEQEFLVNSFLVNPQKKLGIYALLNVLQDAAWMHATDMGHGHSETLASNTAWALTRQRVVMEHWPHWGEKITVRTWVRPLIGPFAVRDFEIIKNKNIIGTATTSWVLIDLEKRTAVLGDLSALPFEPRTDFQLSYDTKKIQIKDALIKRADFEVRNSDLDMNEHVNNTRYVQWLLDSIPRDWHKNFLLKSYDVNFVAETHAGDVIEIFMSPERPDEKSPFIVQFQGKRQTKVVFTAEMNVANASMAE